MNEELLNIFEEAREIIRKQDLSDKTIRYLIDIVDKDIEIVSKKYDKLEKALDIACEENVNRHLPNQSIYTYVYDEKLNLRISTKEDWLNYYLNKAKEELENDKSRSIK